MVDLLQSVCSVMMILRCLFLSYFGLDLFVAPVFLGQIHYEKLNLNSVALNNDVTSGRCFITLSCSFLICQRREETIVSLICKMAPVVTKLP